MANTLRRTRFKDVDLADPFFDSLKKQYKEFKDWFAKKAEEPVYVVDDGATGGVRGFVYLKVETEALNDLIPPLPAARRLKVGTMKVVAKGTKLGERIIKRIFDHAIMEDVEEVYVTVFDTHASLIKLFKRYGFEEKGVKKTPNGEELVLLRSLTTLAGDLVRDYPLMRAKGHNKWLLAVRPEYHTKLFPDSILRTEDPDAVEDVPHTNTIHKVYVAGMTLTRMQPGDLVVIYRTKEPKAKSANYSSVATSVCVVEEAKRRSDFAHLGDFLAFTKAHSVFSEDELTAWYAGDRRLYVVKMTYNAAFPKRPIRAKLIDVVGISVQPRWDMRQLTDQQFSEILELGELDESFIVN